VSPEITGVLVGGGITLAGNLLIQFFAFLQQDRSLKHERQKELMLKRLVAIQNCVKMIDFLVAAKNANLGHKGRDEWIQIRLENSSNGAFFPKNLSNEFKDMIRRSLLHDDLSDSERWLDFQKIDNLRDACIQHIEENFK
jgi:hypothetical protein